MQPGVEGVDAVEWNIDRVRADDVWSTFGAQGEGIVVANIDTGVQWDHPALVNQYRGSPGGSHNYNWWDPYGQSPTVPYDYHSHGSHTMGTMLGDDGLGNQIGMAPKARWFACNGFSEVTGEGYEAELLECADFILAPWDLNGQNPDPDLPGRRGQQLLGRRPGPVVVQPGGLRLAGGGHLSRLFGGQRGPRL